MASPAGRSSRASPCSRLRRHTWALSGGCCSSSSRATAMPRSSASCARRAPERPAARRSYPTAAGSRPDRGARVTRVRGSVYMHWAKLHAAARFNLANSGLLACTTEELGPEPADVQVNGPNHQGYQPLIEAIAARHGARPEQVVTAAGTSGANFLAFAALVEPGDEGLVEPPTYEPLLAALSWLAPRLPPLPPPLQARHPFHPPHVPAHPPP